MPARTAGQRTRQGTAAGCRRLAQAWSSHRPRGVARQISGSGLVPALALLAALAARIIAIEIWRDHLTRLLARHHRHDLERRAGAAAVQYPFLQQPRVVALHQLKAAVEVRLDPAAVIDEAVGERDAAV